MKYTIVIVLIALCFTGCKEDEISNNLTSASSLKVYDFDVQRVKKIHNLFALIDTSAILFLDENGDRTFDISSEDYKTIETLSFKFTDVVAGTKNEIFILGAEILKGNTFQVVVFKVSKDGQRLWKAPVIIFISNNYYIDTTITKAYFFISTNGYTLGCYNNNRLYLVINCLPAKKSEAWYFKLISLNNDGTGLMESDTMQESHPYIWNYMIESLPNGNLLTSLTVGDDIVIHQFDPDTFKIIHTTKILNTDIEAREPIFTNMLYLNNEEVIFTGHANKEYGPVTWNNFDAFVAEYNIIGNRLIDTKFFGVKSNYELTFHSFLDADGNVNCIGTKRDNNVINHTSESNLFEISFNLNSNLIDSLFIIKNKGYEGLYFEPVRNTGYLKILGSKLDISGQQNKQAFFTIIKP